MRRKGTPPAPYFLSPVGCWAVPLTKGAVALIDFCDVDKISKLFWCVVRLPGYRYATCRKRSVSTKMHQYIMGKKDGFVVDHINGNPLDNRRCNLRHATYAQNSQNAPKNKRHGKPTYSLYIGVCWHKTRKHWTARAGGKYNLGAFDSEDDAARAYNKRALELYGDKAKLNTIPDWAAVC